MLRAAFGIFFDTGYGSTQGAFNGAPFTDVRTLSQVYFPLAASLLGAPPLPPFRPYGQINSADPSLVAPRVYQYNATWEHNYGVANTLTVGLVGTAGRDLVLNQTQPAYTSAYNLALLTSNGATSDYHGLCSSNFDAALVRGCKRRSATHGRTRLTVLRTTSAAVAADLRASLDRDNAARPTMTFVTT